MLRTTLISLILFVSLTSSSSISILRKSISRRQSDAQFCQVIEGFDCKCAYHRVTCTNDRDLPTPIKVFDHEKRKYQSVELVMTAPRHLTINDRTFEPVKELFRPDGDNLEFRLKFEKFSGLNLASPSIFNRVFPENLPSYARKHLALEIYNPDVPPTDHKNLFQNLNLDSLELYALYPFQGSFQELFDRANIKYLRLSGGDVRTDLSQPFTGNIGRLELAKQADSLSTQNFPLYPAHELIINAFYINNFNSDNPPNYDNLGELRVHSPNRIPANAFRQFPNIHTLSISTDKEIDPHALDGLTKLEKLTIKDAKPSAELLNNAQNLKEFEASVEKLDEKTQCQMIDKLANGQVAIQAIPDARECTCIGAYLDSAAGRTPCDAQNCEQSSCAAIKTNYDPSTRTFRPPPSIRRSDGTDALRPREPRVYSTPYQVSQKDQHKYQSGAGSHAQAPYPEEDSRRPTGDESGQWQPEQPQQPTDSHGGHDQHERPGDDVDPGRTDVDNNRDDGQGRENQQPGDGNENQAGRGEGDEVQAGGHVVENPSTGEDGQTPAPSENVDAAVTSSTETAAPPKKGMSWLPIIIIIASILGLLLIGLIILFLRKRRNNKGYGPASTSEPAGTSARA